MCSGHVIRAICERGKREKKGSKLNRDRRTREILATSSTGTPRFFDGYYRKMREGSGEGTLCRRRLGVDVHVPPGNKAPRGPL